MGEERAKMNFNDKPEFRKKLVEMATVVGRTITSDEVEPYFKQLDEHPIELILKAMDKALRDRDPTDIFYKNALVTVPEITAAAEEIIKPEEGRVGTIAGCKKCNGTAWIMGQDNEKRAIAWPCACLYAVAKEALKTKSRSTSRENHNKRIVRAYEYHQQRWGGTDVPEGTHGQKI